MSPERYRVARPSALDAVVSALVAAGQSAATSSNLQLFSLVRVQAGERRDRIARLCADQGQIRDGPWFFAVLADRHRLAAAARAVGEEPSALAYTEMYTMAVVDAALAAERLTLAAESLGLGVCYIGALRDDPDGGFGLVGLCLGYPADDCAAAVKPRLGQEAVWHRETPRDLSPRRRRGGRRLRPADGGVLRRRGAERQGQLVDALRPPGRRRRARRPRRSEVVAGERRARPPVRAAARFWDSLRADNMLGL